MACKTDENGKYMGLSIGENAPKSGRIDILTRSEYRLLNLPRSHSDRHIVPQFTGLYCMMHLTLH